MTDEEEPAPPPIVVKDFRTPGQKWESWDNTPTLAISWPEALDLMHEEAAVAWDRDIVSALPEGVSADIASVSISDPTDIEKGRVKYGEVMYGPAGVRGMPGRGLARLIKTRDGKVQWIQVRDVEGNIVPDLRDHYRRSSYEQDC